MVSTLVGHENCLPCQRGSRALSVEDPVVFTAGEAVLWPLGREGIEAFVKFFQPFLLAADEVVLVRSAGALERLGIAGTPSNARTRGSGHLGGVTILRPTDGAYVPAIAFHSPISGSVPQLCGIGESLIPTAWSES